LAVAFHFLAVNKMLAGGKLRQGGEIELIEQIS
jgi:hypothetical protein